MKYVEYMETTTAGWVLTGSYWKPDDCSSASPATSTLTDPALNTCAPADLWEVLVLFGACRATHALIAPRGIVSEYG